MRTKPIPLPLPQSSTTLPMTTSSSDASHLVLTDSSANSASSTEPEDVMMGPANGQPAVWGVVEEEEDEEEELEELDEEEEEEEAAAMADIALDLSLAKPGESVDPEMDEEMAEMAFYDEEDGHSSSPGVADRRTPLSVPVKPPTDSPHPPLMLKREVEPMPSPGHAILLNRPPPPPLGVYCSSGGAPGGPGGDCAVPPLTAASNIAAVAAASLADVMPDQGRLCPVCHKVFRFEKNLYRHMQKAHAAGDGESVLKCKLCNYTTKHYSNMYVHIRTHTGDKPYWCSACGASFTQGSSLKLHIRSRHQENMSFFSLTKKYGKNNLTKLWTRVLKKDLPKFTSPFNHNAAAVAAAAVLENAKAMGGTPGSSPLFFPGGYNSPLPPFSYFSPGSLVFPNSGSPGGPLPPPPPPQPFFLGPTPPPHPGVKQEMKTEPAIHPEADNPPPLHLSSPFFPSMPPFLPQRQISTPVGDPTPTVIPKADKCFQVGMSEYASVTSLRMENDRTQGQLDRLRESAKRLLLSLYSRSLASAAAVRELNGEKIDDLMEHAAKTANSLEAAVALTQSVTYE